MSQTFLLGEVSGGAQLNIAAPIVFDHETVAGTGIEDIALAIDQPWSQGYIGNNYMGGSGSCSRRRRSITGTIPRTMGQWRSLVHHPATLRSS